jgi:hypothetical protein
LATSFSKIPRPWPKDVCRRRYVEGGDNIGFRQLAIDSGRAKSTLQDWSKELIDGLNWAQQRVRFGSRISTAVQQKTIEKTSDKLSDELSEIAIANYERHKLARDYASKVFQIKSRQLAAIQNLPLDEQVEELKKNHQGYEMNYWSQILTRATDAIARATGLDYYVDINASAARVEREGYIISDPTEDEQSQD